MPPVVLYLTQGDAENYNYPYENFIAIGFPGKKASIYQPDNITLKLSQTTPFLTRLRNKIFESIYPNSKHVSLIVFLKVLLTFYCNTS